MKRILSIFVICVMLFSSAAYAMPRAMEITVVVDGEQIEFDVLPIAENGRILVPMRYIFEALGAEVNWIQEENRVIAAKDDINIDVTLGSDIMYRNDAPVKLDVPAKAVDGRTLVPVRAVAEAFDALVEWHQDTYTVNITSAEESNYIPGEYNYTELSEKDLNTLKELFPDLFNMYTKELLYENMAEYPKDVADLINSEDARIRMFADDVWNNMMAHAIINIQTESKDMYIFDIPEEIEIDSYTLMSDYIAITEKENMSSEARIQSSIETTPENRKVLYIKYIPTSVSDANVIFETFDTAVVAVGDGFRFFYRTVNPLRSSEVLDIWEVPSEEIKPVGISADYTKESFFKSIDDIMTTIQ